MINEWNYQVGDLIELTLFGRQPRIGCIMNVRPNPSGKNLYDFIDSTGFELVIWKTKLDNSVVVKVLAKAK